MLSALRPGLGLLSVSASTTWEQSFLRSSRGAMGATTTISFWPSTPRSPVGAARLLSSTARTRGNVGYAAEAGPSRFQSLQYRPARVSGAVTSLSDARRFASSDSGSKGSDKTKSTEDTVTDLARKAAEVLGQSKVAGPLGAKAAEIAQKKLAERKERAESSPSTAKSVPPAQLSEDILTIPNVLTIARLLSTPVIGYLVVQDQMISACALLFVSGLTDVLDGWIARRSGKFTVFGSIADPAADKALMTTMVIALAWRGLLPAPLVALILGRDIALVISAFIIRYRSLPEPKTFARYWDPRLPSASVQPTQISKYNTFLQLVLVGTATLLPILPEAWQTSPGLTTAWKAYMGVVAITTVWSGASYLFGTGAVKYLGQKAKEAAKAGVAKRTGGGQ